ALAAGGSGPVRRELAVWGVAALLLGVLVRWARAERLTAALLLAAAVGGWLYAVDGLSILTVRQIPAHRAFHAAASEQALAIPMLLAGIAGAAFGRSKASARPRAPFVLAWLVSAGGLLAV